MIWTLAKKELRLLLRDPKAAIILLAMPFLFILVLGMSLGEGFGQKPDNRLRVSLVDQDQGLPAGTKFPKTSWAKVVQRDLAETAGIRVEIIGSREEAQRLTRDGKRAAVLVFGPEFSKKVNNSSFLVGGNNPFHWNGVRLKALNAELLRDETQGTAASIIEQVAQGTLLRVILPWMVGRAFEKVGDVEFINQLGKETSKVRFTFQMMAPKFKGKEIQVEVEVGVTGFKTKLKPKVKLTEKLIAQMSEQLGPVSLSEILPLLSLEQKKELGDALQESLQKLFPKYKLTAKTWDALTRSKSPPGSGAGTTEYKEEGAGFLKRGALRYQLLVPSYTVMFAFFLVLTVGWLFVAERRQGTLKRLRASPLSRTQILLGKFLPCLLLSVAQGLFLMVAGKLVFDMSWGPEPLWLLLVVGTTSLAAMGLALLIAALAQTETQVAIYGTLLVLVLAGVSGCLMGDRSLMPEQMQEISRITPHAWALDAYRQLLTNPSPNYAFVAEACAVLAAFGVGFVLVAWAALKLD
jgi:ABC-type Na+ efflux pump permease subunit